MPDQPPARRLSVLLGGDYLFLAAYVIVYTWLTVHSYTRIVFEPQAAEHGIALRDCRAVPTCAPDAVDLVQAQESLLDRTIMLVRGTAWLMIVLQVAVLAVVTVSVVAARRSAMPPAAARFAGIAWKVQAAVVAVLLLGYAVLLGLGATTLGDTPDAATLVTFDTAFSSPFLDVGTLYYVAWFVVMNGAAIALTRLLAQPAPSAP